MRLHAGGRRQDGLDHHPPRRPEEQRIHRQGPAIVSIIHVKGAGQAQEVFLR